MRCKVRQDGRKCAREATKLVVVAPGTDNEDGRPYCTQHARLAAASYGDAVVEVRDIV